MNLQLICFRRAAYGVSILFFTLVLFASVVGLSDALAQVPTATPGVVNLSPLGATTVPEAQTAASPTTPPTQMSLVRIEAKDFANVRSEPSTDSSQLGTIRAGETYTVIARYVAWIQFQFPTAPDGRGWVYGELVNVTGDLQSVPEITDPFGTTVDVVESELSESEATLALLIRTPGEVLTATVISPGGGETAQSGLASTPMPTFTYPPGIVALAPTETSVIVGVDPESSGGQTPSTSTPPIVPILVLGGLGLAGLAVGSLRRG